MSERLYSVDSAVITVVLFLSMALAIEVGYRLGARRSASMSAAQREHVGGIQSAFLGVLALLLGFTFSLALQRFDSRSEAVVEEANAIGTAYLRIGLLPQPFQDEARKVATRYIDLRVESGAHTQVDRASLDPLRAKSMQAQDELWTVATRALAADPQGRAPGLFVESVNQLIDSYGRRDAALNRHVPEIVLLLLYGTFVLAGGIVGFASGASAHRPSLVSYIMVALIVTLVFITLDLDRPRRGFIQVSQRAMEELQAATRAGQQGVAKARPPRAPAAGAEAGEAR